MKLVRDDYEQGKGFTLRPVASTIEHKNLLEDKMREELQELVDQDYALGGAFEAGDLIEAIMAYCEVRWGVTEDQIYEAQEKKRERLGGFTRGIVWVEG